MSRYRWNISFLCSGVSSLVSGLERLADCLGSSASCSLLENCQITWTTFNVFFNVGRTQTNTRWKWKPDIPRCVRRKKPRQSMLICIRGCCTLQVYQLRAQKITDKTDRQTVLVLGYVTIDIYIHKKSDMLLHFRIYNEGSWLAGHWSSANNRGVN